MTSTAERERIPLGSLNKPEFVELMQAIRDKHLRDRGGDCRLMAQGRDNRERTGKRRVTTLSRWIREVPGIRSIDIDQLAYCPDCWDPLVWIEVKPFNGPDEWQLARSLARSYGCYAMLAVEQEGTVDQFDNIVIFPSDPRRMPC